MHPAYLVIAAGRSLRSLIPVIAIGVWGAPWWTLGAVGVIVVVTAVGGWRVRSYQVSKGVLRVQSGLFNRTVHTIPAARITAMEAHRGVVQRVFGVWSLKVQTPGDGDRASVHLSCLSAVRLEELRTALSVHHGTGPSPDAPSPADVPFLQHHGVDLSAAPPDGRPVVLAALDTRTLVIAAVTGVSVPLIVAGGFAAWNRLREVLPDGSREWLEHEVLNRGSATAIILVALVAVAVTVSILLTSLRLATFTLTREGNRLRTTGGLLSQRNGTIAVDRVQAVRIIEGFWRQRLGWCELAVEVAGVGRADTAGRTLFPLVRRSDADRFITMALPEIGPRPALLTSVPDRARRRYLTVPMWVAAALTAASIWLPQWWGWNAWWEWLAVAWFPVAALLAWRRAADAGWHADPEVTVIRWRRTFARHTLIARTARVQITRQSATVLQRRAGLAGIRISLSSQRHAEIRYLEAADADRLLHLIGRRRRRSTSTGASRAGCPQPGC